MLFAYFGPETTLPLTSAIAAVAGFGLMFGRQVARLSVSAFRRFTPRPAPASNPRPLGAKVRRDGGMTTPHMKGADRPMERTDA